MCIYYHSPACEDILLCDNGEAACGWVARNEVANSQRFLSSDQPTTASAQSLMVSRGCTPIVQRAVMFSLGRPSLTRVVGLSAGRSLLLSSVARCVARPWQAIEGNSRAKGTPSSPSPTLAAAQLPAGYGCTENRFIWTWMKAKEDEGSWDVSGLDHSPCQLTYLSRFTC